MSDRNIGLFLPGHVAPDAVVRALLAIPDLSAGDFQGEEAPRVGHGSWNGRPYTHVALRLFEVGGLLLLDAVGLPPAQEVEMALATSLSKLAGSAVYLAYNDESALGGHARFEGGSLVSRRAIDGRGNRPVVRDLAGETPLQSVDASDWVWTPIADAVEAGALPLFGAGFRTDDDIAKAIELANAKAAPMTTPAASAASPAPRPAPTPPKAAPEARASGLLGRLARKVSDKVKGR